MNTLSKRVAELFKDPSVEKHYLRLTVINRLADAILLLRKKRGLTQKQLAEKVGTTQAVISRLENASVKPSLETVLKIAEALDAAVDIRIVPLEKLRRHDIAISEEKHLRTQRHAAKGIMWFDFEANTLSSSEKWVSPENASLGKISTKVSRNRIPIIPKSKIREYA